MIYLEHKKSYRAVKGEVPEEDYIVPIGKAQVRREGDHVSLFSYGMMVHYCLEAAEELEREGVSVEVVDLRSLLPLDEESVLTSTRKTGKVLIVTEDTRTGSIASDVSALIADKAFMDLDGPVMQLTAPDVPPIPYSAPMEEFFQPNKEKIVKALRELAAF